MNRIELINRLTALGVTPDRAERLGVSQRYLLAAVAGYQNVQNIDVSTPTMKKKPVAAIVAGNVVGLENVFKLDHWRKLPAGKRDAALDKFFSQYVPAAKSLAAKENKRSKAWQMARQAA